MICTHRSSMLASVLLLLVCNAADGSDGAQLWNDLKVTAKWTDQVDLFGATGLRLEKDDSLLNRVSVQLGLNVRPTPWLTFSPNYQYIVHDPAEDAREHEQRPGVVAAARILIEQAEITLSTGIEYRFREQNVDSWRVRPKFKLRYPFGPDRWGFSGYVADELFYDTSADEFVRNRFFTGFEKRLGSNWSIDFYYCRQHGLQKSEPDLDIIGLAVGLGFDMRNANLPPQRTGK
jgi:hypothetical protein